MTPEKRERIRDGLREHYRGMEQVIERTKTLKKGGYSPRYIKYVLDGKRKNLDILIVAGEVLLELRSQKLRKEERVNAVVRQVESLA